MRHTWQRLALMAVVMSIASFSLTAQTLRPDQEKFRETYKELVETNSV